MVPGHEIVGRVTAVGGEVTRYKVGDAVARRLHGRFAASIATSAARARSSSAGRATPRPTMISDRITGEPTYGGYSKRLVVREEFVLRVPDGLDLSKAAPLLCAGITTYSPLRTWNVGPGSRVGVVGLGGLGHMAVKLAAAMGADVTVISRSNGQRGRRPRARRRSAARLDRREGDGEGASRASTSSSTRFRSSTTSTPTCRCSTSTARWCWSGRSARSTRSSTVPLLLGRRRVAGSPIGGIAETQEMLNFCAKKGVLPEVEMIRMDQINEAFERLERSDVRYRFVIDMASLHAAA